MSLFWLDADVSVWHADLIHVGQGSHLKKTWPHGRGRSGVRRMYRSHLTVGPAFLSAGCRTHCVLYTSFQGSRKHVLVMQVVLRESDAKRFSQFQLPLMERQRRFV